MKTVFSSTTNYPEMELKKYTEDDEDIYMLYVSNPSCWTISKKLAPEELKAIGEYFNNYDHFNQPPPLTFVTRDELKVCTLVVRVLFDKTIKRLLFSMIEGTSLNDVILKDQRLKNFMACINSL